MPWVGGQHLKHPDEHRQWGKLCPSSWEGLAGRGGWWDQALCLLSMPGGRGSRLTAANRQGWAGEAGSFPVLLGISTSSSCLALELLRGTIYKSHPREKQGGDNLKITTWAGVARRHFPTDWRVGGSTRGYFYPSCPQPVIKVLACSAHCSWSCSLCPRRWPVLQGTAFSQRHNSPLANAGSAKRLTNTSLAAPGGK